MAKKNVHVPGRRLGDPEGLDHHPRLGQANRREDRRRKGEGLRDANRADDGLCREGPVGRAWRSVL